MAVSSHAIRRLLSAIAVQPWPPRPYCTSKESHPPEQAWGLRQLQVINVNDPPGIHCLHLTLLPNQSTRVILVLAHHTTKYISADFPNPATSKFYQDCLHLNTAFTKQADPCPSISLPLASSRKFLLCLLKSLPVSNCTI